MFADDQTTAPDVAPPLGADVDFWTDEGFRDVFDIIGLVEISTHALECPIVTLAARQNRNGTLSAIAISVDLGKQEVELSVEHAQRLAVLLTLATVRAAEWTAL